MSEDRDNMQELLSAYIDGEATDQQAASIEQAVATDPELAIELHELKAAKRLLNGLPKERAPRGFVRKVMVRAERKHLLGDHHAGGRFAAARWITLAVAATVLLAAGIGIIAINRLNENRRPPEVAIDTERGGQPDLDNTGDIGLDTAGIAKKGAGDDFNGTHEKGRGSDNTALAVNGGTRLVVGDEAFAYAVANAKEASIYTHDVSDTLAVLNDTLHKNNVQPLELDADDSGFAAKDAPEASDKKADVSRGELNFYFNKKQDEEQVQVVVMASPEVIEQVNGDLNRIAFSQKVSQAPVMAHVRPRADGMNMARRAGPAPSAKRGRQGGGEGMAIASGGAAVTNDPMGSGSAPVPAKSKVSATTGGSVDAPNAGKGVTAPAPKAPAPTVTDPAPVVIAKAPKPVDNEKDPVGEVSSNIPGTAVSQTRGVLRDMTKKVENADSKPDGSTQTAGVEIADAAVAGSDGWVGKVLPKPSRPAGRPEARPAPKPLRSKAMSKVSKAKLSEPVVIAVGPGPGEKYEQKKQTAELETLSAKIVEVQKGDRSREELDERYSKLNSAIRRQIMTDNVMRNVQSQRDKGINVQALVININRRSLRGLRLPATQNAIIRARAARQIAERTPASGPAAESTTQKSAEKASSE